MPVLTDRAILNMGGVPAVTRNVYAAFTPLTTTESAEVGRDPSAVSYRMTFKWPTVLPSTTTVTWRGTEYQFVGPSMMHTVGRQLHHQEAIITRATG